METEEVFVSFDFITGHVCLNPFMGTDHGKNITFLRRVRLPSKRQIKPLRISIYILWLHSPSGPRPPPCRGFEITLRHTTVGRTPLHEWSTRRRDLYLTTHNNHKTQTSMSPAGFEPWVPASERPQSTPYNAWPLGSAVSPYGCKKSRNAKSITWMSLIQFNSHLLKC
jgi:hypothetical protein